MKYILFDKEEEPGTYAEALSGAPWGYKLPTWSDLAERFEMGLFEKYKKDFYLYVWTTSQNFDQYGVPFHYLFDLASGKSAMDYADKRFRVCYLRED